jgi:membrane associated rhomboid family serine protease
VVRAAIFGWAVVLLLAGLVAQYFEYSAFGDIALELAILGFIVGLLMQVVSAATDVLRQSLPPSP